MAEGEKGRIERKIHKLRDRDRDRERESEKTIVSKLTR